MASRNRFLEKMRSLLIVTSGATGMFAGLNFYQGNEKFYDSFIMPAVHKFSPETSHRLAIIISKYRLFPSSSFKDPESIKIKVWSLDFKNPVGIAAGFDKHGEAVDSLHKIGFGFVEVGTVTPLPQPGNEKPRVFRLLEDQAIINRYGFNSDGYDAVYDRLYKLKSSGFKGVIGVNLGKNRNSEDPISDYVNGIKKFGLIADYIVINVSSPNTPGLRQLQQKEDLEELLRNIVAARDNLPRSNHIPLLLKLAPDLTMKERKDIASVITKKNCMIDGLVISNTTTERPDLNSINHLENGGLSGKPLNSLSTTLIKDMYHFTKGKIPIIGVGGVFTGEDAYEKIKAGASLIQLYTSFIYHGPPRITRIKQELDAIVRKNGFSSVSEVIGKGS